ncbi:MULTISPECIES: hypothetical protein [unclassified Sphingobium]|uniref:hypothetical protein n=1 Tax=unclassified Sphingobium TaxID=2611147 RepID=UPI002224AED9|nr:MULTISPECIES: hypothetical protein [unclassified Sphingobium]MCW2393798.1 hypothetical protein [Sphingobium sp. B8D3B]MCW2417312.1 hypothetical protein [Sphingobium sp. B8D3C]
MPGAPHLSPADIDQAVDMLKGWSSKLTWDLFLRTLAMELPHGHVYSKVAMLKHERIKSAWSEARQRLADEVRAVGEKGHGRTVVAALRAKLDEARKDLSEERRRNNELIEQFKRWQYNAERHGIKYSQLDAPLQRPSR